MSRWVEFACEPLKELVRYADHPDGWSVTGNDPQFACKADDFILPGGWYRLELDMALHAGPMMKACLYPDYGPGEPPDVTGIHMPFVWPDLKQHAGLVRFARDLHGLRFDPAVCPCDFSLHGLRVRRIGRLQALAVLLRFAIGGQVGWKARMHMAASLARRALASGPRALGDFLYQMYVQDDAPVDDTYDVWVQLYDTPNEAQLRKARKRVNNLSRRPVLSVLVPTYNTEERWLRRCIESVKAQVYESWELCIADDASTQPHVMRVLREYAESDSRIKVIERKQNGHISATSNSALEEAQGDYVALLDHDDELHPLALYEVACALEEHPRWRLIYSDEDKIDDTGRRYDPYMKPDWNYDLFLSHNCISHLGIYDRKLLSEIGGFREGFEGSQDWDLALRCIERLDDDEIGHIPKALYQWRAIPGSTALAPQEKNYAHDAGLRAVNEHLKRVGAKAVAEEIQERRGNFRIRYRLPPLPPKISLVVPTRDRVDLLRQCVASILGKTTYENYEVVIVDNQSSEPDTLAYFSEIESDPRVRVLKYDKPFNYSALNNYAVAHADGELIGLINNDIEVITPDWLEEMAGQAMRADVGAVGAMLYYPDDTIQHAGVVLGVHGVAAHAYSRYARGYTGQMGRARLVQEMSAVTAACLLIRRETFDEVGGLNEELKVAFNDVDFCLRVRAAGYRNIWTPFAELYHHESATRGREDSPEKMERFRGEVEYMMSRWGDVLRHDPAYNPNLTISDEPFHLAFPPRE